MRRLLAGVALAGGLAGAGPSLTGSSAGASAPVPIAAARLTGSFVLAGRVTVADNISGEHRGEVVQRTWTFSSSCAAGPCSRVTLVRQRARGSDRLVLHRQAPGYYVGYSNFFRPVRCGSRVYRPGERVPFRITVRVTQALLATGGTVIASRVNATYRNQVRYNLTPCVAYLGHDAASFHGHVVLAPSG